MIHLRLILPLALLVFPSYSHAYTGDCDADFEDGVDPSTAAFVGYPGFFCGPSSNSTCYTSASGRKKPSIRLPFDADLRCEAGFCAEIGGGVASLCENGSTCNRKDTVCVEAQDGRLRCLHIGHLGEFCKIRGPIKQNIAASVCIKDNECKEVSLHSQCFSKAGASKGSECAYNTFSGPAGDDLCASEFTCTSYRVETGFTYRCAEVVTAGTTCAEGSYNVCDAPGEQDWPTCRDGICRNGLGHPCDNGEVCDTGLTCVEYGSRSPGITAKQRLCSDLNGDVGEKCKFQQDSSSRFQNIRTCRNGLICKRFQDNPCLAKRCPPYHLCALPEQSAPTLAT